MTAAHADNVLSFGDHLLAIAAESNRLLIAADDQGGRTVPTCPDWTVVDLVSHVTRVYRFWTVQAQAGDPTAPIESTTRAPSEAGEDIGELAAQLEHVAEELVASLAEAGPDRACWNWSGEHLDARWVARRMALETAIHRYDAELTSGRATPIAADLAVDGIDEFLMVHLWTDIPAEPSATLGGSFCLACDDASPAWTVEIGGGRLRVRGEAGPASACVKGSASDLFLFVWNRVGVDALHLTGDRAVAEAWAALPH